MIKDKNISILIIEDDHMFRDMAYEVFDGYNRIMAENAKEGLKKFKQYCPDITLLDIGLPDKNGLELLPELIEFNPEAFIVMLTASSLAKDVENAKEHGAAGYITKPFSYKKVEDCIIKYEEYREKLKKLSSEERASHLIKTLKVEAVDEDLLREREIERKRLEKEKAIREKIKTWRVLFVDDYPTNRKRAGTQLKKLGCEVDIAGSGQNALDLAAEHKYDLIFLDTRMRPGMDGYEVAETLRIREKDGEKETSIIIGMIEFTDEIEAKLWKEIGMDNYIKKPSRFSDLREMMEKYAKEEIKKDKENEA